MSIRSRVASALVGPEYAKARETANLLKEIYERRSSMISEVDQRTAHSTNAHLNQILLSGDPGDEGITEGERLEGVRMSRRMYHWDVLYKAIVRLWTNFGFGRTVSVVCRDPAAQEVWGEFWEADRNSRWLGERIHTLSHRILVDGEFFPTIFTSKKTGLSTVRIVKTDQIAEILSLPEDQDVPVWYKRSWTPNNSATPQVLYYKNWAASEDDVEMAQLEDNQNEAESDTAMIVMQHAMLPGLFPRGVPLLLAGQLWSREYADFLQDRRAVSKLVAMFAEDITVSGGSRGVDSMLDFFQSTLAAGGDYETNPPPAVGSPYVHNESVRPSRSPLTTGAGDAMQDGAMFLGQVGMAGGVYPHYLGMGEAFRLATATSMEWPTEVQWELYRNLWATIWRNMVKAVLNGYSEVTGQEFEDMTVDVSTDALVRPNIEDTATALKAFYLEPVEKGLDPLISYEIAATQALRVLNVSDPAEVLEKMELERKEAEPEQATAAYEEIEALYQQALETATTDQEREDLQTAISVVRERKKDEPQL